MTATDLATEETTEPGILSLVYQPITDWLEHVRTTYDDDVAQHCATLIAGEYPQATHMDELDRSPSEIIDLARSVPVE